jgi:GTP-binding protein EngB required for normal cell division
MEESLTAATFLCASEEERAALLAAARGVLKKVEHLTDHLLTVGLLGGTGVGKSTLMNALAEAPIASVSHRRPHTRDILIYRHESAPIPEELVRTAFPWREITHQAPVIRQLLLCDLPDFDSVVAENRQQVLGFLTHLDVLLWVTSLEKYADAPFYDFLLIVTKAQQNFIFIVNKIDRLFSSARSDSGYQALAALLEQFQRHIIQQGVKDPVIYALSAEEAQGRGPLAPWNQFGQFRGQIFRERDVKEIVAIKAANLDREVEELLAAVAVRRAQLERLAEAVQGFREELDGLRSEWLEAGRATLLPWVQRHLRSVLDSQPPDTAGVIGPGRLLAAAAGEWRMLLRQLSSAPPGAASTAAQPLADWAADGAPPLQHHYQRVENRLVRTLLQRGLPVPWIDRVRTAWGLETAWQDFSRKIGDCLRDRLTDPSPPGKRWNSRLFLGVQYLSYALSVLLLLLVVAGRGVWKVFLGDPGVANALDVALAFLETLFSPRGFAALGSFVMLQLVLGWRFLARVKKRLRRSRQKFIDSVSVDIERLWETEFTRVRTACQQLHEDLRAQADSLIRQRRDDSPE